MTPQNATIFLFILNSSRWNRLFHLEWQNRFFPTLGLEKQPLKFGHVFILTAKDILRHPECQFMSGQQQEKGASVKTNSPQYLTFPTCELLHSLLHAPSWLSFYQVVMIIHRFPWGNYANKIQQIPVLEKLTDFHPLSISKGEMRDVWSKERLTQFLFIMLKGKLQRACLEVGRGFWTNARDKYVGCDRHYKSTWENPLWKPFKLFSKVHEQFMKHHLQKPLN